MNLNWLARQVATGLDFKGDRIEPHEILSYERLLRAGEVVEPIWNDPSRPTSDFDWVSRDVRNVELKHGRMDPRTVMNPVLKAALRAATHPWRPMVKDCFLLDFGEEPITAEVRAAIRGHNKGRRKYRVSRLWVMHNDGEIEELDLEP